MSNYAVKQVILLRTDLNMRKGKMCAMAAHASMKVFFDGISLTEDVVEWINGSFAKIVLGVDTEADLLRAYEAAIAAGLPAALIVDSGFTEFHGVPTRTAVAIGPARTDAIDVITGKNGIVPTRLL